MVYITNMERVYGVKVKINNAFLLFKRHWEL